MVNTEDRVNLIRWRHGVHLRSVATCLAWLLWQIKSKLILSLPCTTQQLQRMVKQGKIECKYISTFIQNSHNTTI